MSVLFPLALSLVTPAQAQEPNASAAFDSGRYEDLRLVRRVVSHHWTETVINTEYSDDSAVTTARDVARQSRNWNVLTGTGTPMVSTMDFAARVGDTETLDRLDRQAKQTRVLAIGGIAGGVATAAVSYLALAASDGPVGGVGYLVPSVGIGVAGVSLLPHLGVLQKRSSIHSAYTEPEVDGWIRSHNDTLASETGSIAARAQYPDVEQVATYGQ